MATPKPFEAAPGVTGTAFQQPAPGSDGPAALAQLEAHPQQIDCPNCSKRTQTRVEGRSKGKQTFMNVMWWPLPGRRHWWEKTHWFCENCDYELAVQKYGKDLEVLWNGQSGSETTGSPASGH